MFVNVCTVRHRVPREEARCLDRGLIAYMRRRASRRTCGPRGIVLWDADDRRYDVLHEGEYTGQVGEVIQRVVVDNLSDTNHGHVLRRGNIYLHV